MTRSIGESQEATHRERGSIPEDTFASRLMLARVHAGYQTIDEASAKCGLNRQSWSNWEKGMKPRDLLDVVNAISDGLGVDRDWLLFGGPLTTPEPAGRRQLKRRRNQGAGATTESGARTVRPTASSPNALVTASNAVQRGPFAHTSDRPTASVHRPGIRRERAHTGPAATRPAILPRRTLV